MTIRPAGSGDAAGIASLHAASWQTAYRGILREEFLQGPVVANRLRLWRQRLCDNPPQGQYTFIVEHGGKILAFACAFLDADLHWGTLLDNLHVAPGQKGQGLGGQLMAVVAQTVIREGRTSALHLWVYEQNLQARRFYERLGGRPTDSFTELAPDGERVNALRYAWPQLEVLAQGGRDG